MIVLSGQGNDRGVVVAPTKAGFHKQTIGLLLAQQAISESEWQFAPEIVESNVCDIALLRCHHRGGATARLTAKSGGRSPKRGLKERLGLYRLSAGDFRIEIVESVGERLPAHGHHPRDRIQINGLILVPDDSTHVAKLQYHPAGKFPLDAEVKLIGARRPEIGIKLRCITSLCRINAGEVRLRQRLSNGRQRSRIPVSAD